LLRYFRELCSSFTVGAQRVLHEVADWCMTGLAVGSGALLNINLVGSRI
jgi:hypothetical protein